jgi:hypothetical protein
MSRRSPRFVPAGFVVEITAQTVGQRFLLRPSEALNRVILAVLGRALALFPVDLHAFAFMSNHWHALVSVPDGLALSRFVQHVHSNIARAVNSMLGTEGAVFGRASFIMVGEDAEQDRLRYVLAQGVKEGLVARCTQWPGVHCARALLREEVLVGRWRDGRHERQIRGGGRSPGRPGGRAPSNSEVEKTYPIDLVPLPSWRPLDEGQRYLRVREIMNEIERAAKVAHPVPLGVRGVLARDPFSKPVEVKRAPAPRIHTHSGELREAFTAEHLAFSEGFLDAAWRLKSGGPAAVPARAFAPIVPFCSSFSTLWRADVTRAIHCDLYGLDLSVRMPDGIRDASTSERTVRRRECSNIPISAPSPASRTTSLLPRAAHTKTPSSTTSLRVSRDPPS